MGKKGGNLSENNADFEECENVDPKGKLIKEFKVIRSEENTYREREHFIMAFNKKP